MRDGPRRPGLRAAIRWCRQEGDSRSGFTSASSPRGPAERDPPCPSIPEDTRLCNCILLGLQYNVRWVGRPPGGAQVVASGPVGPRRRLGAELRRLRTAKGFHLDHVAGELGCSTSKISRLETGKGIPKPADVRRLLRIYDATAVDRDLLMRLVRDSRAEGWWESYTDGVPLERFFLDGPGRYAALESDAVALLSFDSAILHGLLQIPEYARAVLSAELPDHSPSDVDQLVELRLRRQEALHRPRPLRLSAVVDESVFART